MVATLESTNVKQMLGFNELDTKAARLLQNPIARTMYIVSAEL